MKLSAITEKLLAAKRQKKFSFTDLEKHVGRDEVWLAAVFYRQATASQEEAAKIAKALDLSNDEVQELCQVPTRGLGPAIPTDPVLYRLYEIVLVYGMPIKEIIHEKFGDGIMSAIDFSIDINKEEDPKGDRIVMTLNGKFLPYRKW
jgi:cyanate lyase